jgi:sugar lactone lactonase YvrE
MRLSDINADLAAPNKWPTTSANEKPQKFMKIASGTIVTALMVVGLTFDPVGRLTINQHGNHRVVRLEPDGRLIVLTDKFEGKRLNSPNDLVYRSDGTLYFTDPPFGLPKFSTIRARSCRSAVCSP